MAFIVMPCGGEKCDRLLYVEVDIGEQAVLCYKCGSGNLVEFKKDEDDEG